MKTVEAYSFEGWNISPAMLFGVGPKFTITCGECLGSFRKRIPLVDYPGVQCPYCGTINRIRVVVGEPL